MRPPSPDRCGHWRDEHIFELTQALELYRFYQGKIVECDLEIEASWSGSMTAAMAGVQATTADRPVRQRAPLRRQDTPVPDHGVDLTRINGIDGFTALKVIRKVGTDMTEWPAPNTSRPWLGLSPDHRITGGRVMSSRTKPSANREAHKLARLIYSCCATAKSTLMPVPSITSVSTSNGRYVLPIVERHKWATGRCPCPMLRNMPLTHLQPAPIIE